MAKGRDEHVPSQMSLGLASPRPKLRVVSGEGQGRSTRLTSRDDVARVLMRSAADLLLRRITSARAEAIRRKVDAVLDLFDAARTDENAARALRRELDALEALSRRNDARKPQDRR